LSWNLGLKEVLGEPQVQGLPKPICKTNMTSLCLWEQMLPDLHCTLDCLANMFCLKRNLALESGSNSTGEIQLLVKQFLGIG
jgi:hypothetical protein